MGFARRERPAEGYYTEDMIVMRLRDAADTLRRLPFPKGAAPSNAMGFSIDIVRDTAEAYGYDQERIKPAAPSAKAISDMEEALGWLLWVTDKRCRQVVWARSVMSPVNDKRHVLSWRRLEDQMQLSETSLRNAFDQAILTILRKLNA